MKDTGVRILKKKSFFYVLHKIINKTDKFELIKPHSY